MSGGAIRSHFLKEKIMVSGIYKLTCVVNDKAYIGKIEGKIEARVN